MDENTRIAIAEMAAGAGQSANRQSAYAEMIVESVEPNNVSLDIFNLFLPTRQLNVGDSLVKKVKNYGFPVWTFVPGTTHLTAVPVPPREVLTYALDEIITKIRMNSREVQRGELGTVEDLRSQMRQSLINEIIARCWTMIGSIWNGSTARTNYHDASSGGITGPILDGMMDTVSYHAGQVRGIFGTQRALRPIYNFAGFVERTGTGATAATPIAINSIMEEWARTGRVTSYKGVPLVEVPQVFARTASGWDTPLIREDRIYVIGDNAGEIILYGDVDFQDHLDYDVEPADYVMAMWRQFGMIVDRPDRIGYIKIAQPTNQYEV